MATDWDYHAGVCEESTRWTSPFFSYSWTKCRTLSPATHTHQDDGPPSLWEIRWAAIWFVLSLYASAHTCTHTHALPFTHLSTLAQWWRIWERKIGFCTTECSWIRFIIDLSWCSGEKKCSCQISLQLTCKLEDWMYHYYHLMYQYWHLKECIKSSYSGN